MQSLYFFNIDMIIIDEINKKILNTIQTDFPISFRPYKVIAQKLKMSENELLQRIRQMKKDKLIRRIGANFSPVILGFYSTLCAAKVSEDKIDLFTKTINSYPGVTHNYKRDHEFNIWFTFISPSPAITEDNIKQISDKTKIKGILNLPATKVFKISANFKL